MLEHLRAPFKKLIEPIAKALIAIGLTANAVTVIGAVGEGGAPSSWPSPPV